MNLATSVAILAAALSAGCSRGDPALPERAASGGERAARTKAKMPAPVPPDAKAAASCPPLPELTPLRLAPADRRWRLPVAATAKGENKTRSYRIDRLAAGRSGARWAGAAYDGAALWEGDKRVRELPCGDHGCLPHDAVLADDGKTLLLGLGRVDLQTGATTALSQAGLALAQASTNEVTAIAWPPDGGIAVLATHYRPIACCRDSPRAQPQPSDVAIAIDGATGTKVHDLGAIPGFSSTIAVSPGQIVARTTDGLTVWDRASYTATRREGPPGASRLVFDRPGRWLASSEREEITLWRMPDFCPVARFALTGPFVHAMAFHPTAPVLFAATDRALRVLSLDTPGEELGSAGIAGDGGPVAQMIDSLVVTGDGTRLVVPLYMRDDIVFYDVTPP